MATSPSKTSSTSTPKSLDVKMKESGYLHRIDTKDERGSHKS